MKVFVLSHEGKPLMPTTPRRARLWLRHKRARVVHCEPFTIRLLFPTMTYTQATTVGVDMGSQTVGVAAVTNGKAVYQAEVHLRIDISSKLLRRRQYRRNRRSRKTRYRAARFANRCRHASCLPPSLRSKGEATLKAVCFVASILPVSQVNVEVGSFDTQKMQNPEIQGIEYHQGQIEGYQLREYLLLKWQRRCAYCGASGLPLQVEHIIPKARGGSDSPSNLTLACEPCNQTKGDQTAREFGFPDVQVQARLPLRDAAHVSSIKTWVLGHLKERFSGERVQVTYGYETKYKRIQVLGLPKSHTNDAIAIACAMGEVAQPASEVYQMRCVPRGNYQHFNGKRSEHKVWAPKKLHGWKLYELVEVKRIVGYIGGRRLKGAFVIKGVATGKTVLEVTPRKLQRLARSKHSWIIAWQSLGRKEERASSSVF
jgi:5-methylcytosine-specific restriction endonuclease McrA